MRLKDAERFRSKKTYLTEVVSPWLSSQINLRGLCYCEGRLAALLWGRVGVRDCRLGR
jgi:hypothetical protein